MVLYAGIDGQCWHTGKWGGRGGGEEYYMYKRVWLKGDMCTINEGEG